MSYLALAKKAEDGLDIAPKKPLGSLLRDLNITVLIEIYGHDVWLIPDKTALSQIGEGQIYCLPDEIEILSRMDAEAVKEVFLVKQVESGARLINYRSLQ